MKIIGSVREILDEEHALVQISGSRDVGDVVFVLGRVPTSEDIKASTGLSELIYTKGELKLMSLQPDTNYWLACRFRDATQKRVVHDPFGGAYAGLLGTYETVETVYGPWSAEFPKVDPKIGHLRKTVEVGDSIGTEKY